SISIDGNRVSFSLVFERQNDPFAKSVVKAAEQAVLLYADENADIKGNIEIRFKPQAEKQEDKPAIDAKHIIAVSSGKGGVGKSTVSANLAVALARLGYRVGLLDADIHGPSVPKMFGVEDAVPQMEERDGKHYILPVTKYGVKLLSIGFFVEPDNALVWRGAMASNAIKQLINDANWGELDYFLIDMPPGTSDIHLAVTQLLNVSGAIIVSTPQEVALADARKGISLFRNEKVNIPILGIVENMAWFTPAELPENKYYIFGNGGAKRLAEELQVPLLGQIPLVQAVCSAGDCGTPIAYQDSITGEAFMALAKNIVK
ncbi:MAG: Mrp/NBP35 family ATP-binding protein, partial [Prevotellaceae bacterium]|nr:Mrp/NBP35 family ATP-binding protein [Prevotellaceae bacterium]